MPPRTKVPNLVTSDIMPGAPAAPVDVGLTDAEINADLEALGVDYDPAAPREDRLELREIGRAMRAENGEPEPAPPSTGGAPEPGPEPVQPEVGAVLRRGSSPPATAPTGPMCTVRITKAGHGQVYTGKARPRTYSWNDEIALPREIGEQLEARHFGEVLD